MQRGLLLLASAGIAAGGILGGMAVGGILAGITVRRMQKQAAARAAAAQERENALILAVDQLSDPSSQKPLLRALR